MSKFELKIVRSRLARSGIYFNPSQDNKTKIDELARRSGVNRAEIIRQMMEHCLKEMPDSQNEK